MPHKAAVWPSVESTQPAAAFSERAPLRKLVVVIDAGLLDAATERPRDDLGILAGLLSHDYITVLRYADHGPPESVLRIEHPLGQPAAAGWIEVGPEDKHARVFPVVSCDGTNIKQTGIIGDFVPTAEHDTSSGAYEDLEPKQAATRRRADAIAMCAAGMSGVHMFITRRDYLHRVRWNLGHGVLAADPEDALHLVALYLRAQGVFDTWRSVDGTAVERVNRGLFYANGARALLPAWWRWRNAISQHVDHTAVKYEHHVEENRELRSLTSAPLTRVAHRRSCCLPGLGPLASALCGTVDSGVNAPVPAREREDGAQDHCDGYRSRRVWRGFGCARENALMTFSYHQVESVDGTRIGFRSGGSGPPLVLVHGGMLASQHFVALGTALVPDFQVAIPDRRGRGQSGPYRAESGRVIDQEAADIRAVIDEVAAGGVFGLSSGAIVALNAAKATGTVTNIALYEPPLSIAGSVSLEWIGRFDQEIAAGNPVRAMITAMHGLKTDPIMSRLPHAAAPLLKLLLRTQHAEPDEVPVLDLIPTIRQDIEIVKETADSIQDYSAIHAEVLLLGASKSPAYLARSLEALGAALPNARRITLPGLDHQAPFDKPDKIAPILKDFFLDLL